jgi:hypothetical protein
MNLHVADPALPSIATQAAVPADGSIGTVTNCVYGVLITHQNVDLQHIAGLIVPRAFEPG